MQNTNNVKTVPSPALSEDVRNRLNSILADNDKAEAFADAFYEQYFSDDEPPEKKGRYMAQAILDNKIEDFLMAVCGWTTESLLNFAEV